MEKAVAAGRAMDDQECTFCEAMMATAANVFANPTMVAMWYCSETNMQSLQGVTGLTVGDLLVSNLSGLAMQCMMMMRWW